MDTYVSDLPVRTDDLDNQEQRIKEHLKIVVPEEIYEKWIEYFVFESISRKKIVIGYYGIESLKEFKKNYGEFVWIQICSVVGYSKKMEIHKRKLKVPRVDNVQYQKHLMAAKWFGLSLIFAAVTLVAAVLAGNYMINRNFKETFYNVSSLKVNSQIRIIQVSDLHNSEFGKDNSKMIARVEKLKPDLILFTGDCLDSSASSFDKLVRLCSRLAETAPLYYIYGNNEEERFYDVPLSQGALDKKFGFNDGNRDPSKLLEIRDDFAKELEKNGVKVLKNGMDSIMIGSTKVDIYGVLTSNPSSFWSYAGESFNEYLYNNLNNLKITVLHEPIVFETYETDTWGDIMICGHTHGGFTRLPFLGGLYTHEGGFFPDRKGSYVYGRYDVAGSPLIVSSGLSNANLFRINNQPELVIIDINKF